MYKTNDKKPTTHFQADTSNGSKRGHWNRRREAWRKRANTDDRGRHADILIQNGQGINESIETGNGGLV